MLVRCALTAGTLCSVIGRALHSIILAVTHGVVWVAAAVAGPPFITDDAETPDKGQFEIDVAAQYAHRRGETSGSLPSVEVDYGLTSHLQLHILGANAFDRRSGGHMQWGSGDTELGAKYRFIDQARDSWLPAAAVFPTIEVPTGDERRGLGTGRVRAFLPLWLERQVGSWELFGGGGYWINPGPGNQNFGFLGLGVWRAITRDLSLGAELFHTTADTVGGRAATSFNLGGSYELGTGRYLIFSLGRGLRNAGANNQFSSFLDYQLLF